MDMNMEALKQEIILLTSADLSKCSTEAEMGKNLAAFINDLINRDFDALVQLLYRIDISEEKLKKLLRENPGENAGDIIARLIIERQLQKAESRKRYGTGDTSASDEMKW